MSRNVLVIGVGQFGAAIATELIAGGLDVTVVDPSESRVKALIDRGAHGVIGSGTDPRALHGLDLERFDAVVNAVGEESLEASIFCTQLLEEMGARSIIVRVVSDTHARIVNALGATRSIHPEQYAARRLARQIAHPGLKGVLDLSSDDEMVNLEIPESWVDQSLKDLGLRATYGVNVVGVRRGDKQAGAFRAGPDPDEPLRRGDELRLMGAKEDVRRLLKEHG